MEKVWLKSYPEGIPENIDDKVYDNLNEFFERSCEKYSDRPAFTNMGKTFTFAETFEQADRFARFLQNDLGLKKGDRIAIQLPNCLQYPIALFGALRAGLVVVNTNPLYTEREMEHQFKDSGAKAILIAANFASKLEEVISQTEIKHVIVTELGDMLGFPKRLIVNTVVKHVKKMVPSFRLPNAIGFNEALSRGASLSYTKPEVTREEIAFLQYTGGTTGVSKGAMLTHHNLIANLQQMLGLIRFKLNDSGEKVFTPLPLYHVFALTVNCFGFVMLGAENILVTNPRDMKALTKEFATSKPTVMTAVNTLFNAMLNYEPFRQLDHSHLKIACGGGMAVQRAVADEWLKVTGCFIAEGYGLTESSPILSLNPVDGSGRPGIGLPAPSTVLKIAGDDNGTEAPLGERGEIWASGPQIMKGYWQRPDATDEVITKDGWLKTGDIGVMDDAGFFRIVDRKKEMILVSGFNVYPNEIEDVMVKHPGVSEVACIGVPDEKSGEAVKVFIVPKSQNLSLDELKSFASENLTGYKKPRHIEFREDLPKSNVGKVLRRILKEEEMKKNGAHA